MPAGRPVLYGVIDRVVVEPAAGPAERVQVWGAFALMETIGSGFTGYVYKRPARGYLLSSGLPTEPVRSRERETGMEGSGVAGWRRSRPSRSATGTAIAAMR